MKSNQKHEEFNPVLYLPRWHVVPSHNRQFPYGINPPFNPQGMAPYASKTSQGAITIANALNRASGLAEIPVNTKIRLRNRKH